MELALIQRLVSAGICPELQGCFSLNPPPPPCYVSAWVLSILMSTDQSHANQSSRLVEACTQHITTRAHHYVKLARGHHLGLLGNVLHEDRYENGCTKQRDVWVKCFIRKVRLSMLWTGRSRDQVGDMGREPNATIEAHSCMVMCFIWTWLRINISLVKMSMERNVIPNINVRRRPSGAGPGSDERGRRGFGIT